MTPITVVRHARICSWPRHADAERAYTLDLGRALERLYTTDAHFAVYSSRVGHRLCKEALEALGGVTMSALVFDLDGPNHEATREWRLETRARVQALDAAHPGLHYYETRGGARLVYRLAEPETLSTEDDARKWSQQYLVAVAHFERRFGLKADPACHDWQRLFRLPRATRDPESGPENRPTWGNPHAIGALSIDATRDDVEAAKSRAKRSFAPRREFTPNPNPTGDGLLYELLRARGDIGSNAPNGGYIVRCPNRAEHSSNTDGSTSTVLYPADGAGQAVGLIHCKHAHCSELRAREWLRFFSDSEIKAARVAAGIERAA